MGIEHQQSIQVKCVSTFNTFGMILVVDLPDEAVLTQQLVWRMLEVWKRVRGATSTGRQLTLWRRT